MTLTLESIAILSGAPILPNNGVIDWFASLSIPDYGGFSLISYADSRNFFWANACFNDGGLSRVEGSPPDIRGAVFNPARIGKVLLEFFLR